MIAARRGELLSQVANDIAASGHPRPIVIAQNIMTDDAPESLSAKAKEAPGTINILINSAGDNRKGHELIGTAGYAQPGYRNI